jgi:hypothetical protein
MLHTASPHQPHASPATLPPHSRQPPAFRPLLKYRNPQNGITPMPLLSSSQPAPTLRHSAHSQSGPVFPSSESSSPAKQFLNDRLKQAQCPLTARSVQLGTEADPSQEVS